MAMQDNEPIWGGVVDDPILASALPGGGEGEELSEDDLDGVAGGGDMPPQEPIDPIEEPPEFPSGEPPPPDGGDPNDPGNPDMPAPVPPPPDDELPPEPQ